MATIKYILRALGSTLIQTTLSRDIAGRLNLQVLQLRDISARLLLTPPVPVQVSHDVGCRMNLQASPSSSALFGYPQGIVLSPLRATKGFAGIGVGPGVGQPADTIGGPRQ